MTGRNATTKNDLIVPALIIAAGIVVGFVLFRILPTSGPPMEAGIPGGPPRPFLGATNESVRDPVRIAGSENAVIVNEIKGRRITVILSPMYARRGPLDLVVSDSTSMVDKDGKPLQPPELRPGDLIVFEPRDVGPDTKEIAVDRVTLLFRPPDH